MIKYTCIIDTCSFVNLTLFEFNQGTLLDLLREKVNIKYSSEVHRIEIPNHYNELMPSREQRINYMYPPQRLSCSEYERRLFGSNEPRINRNKGEKDNLSVIIDIFLTKKTKGLVFLTDDYKALRGCLNPQVFSFPLYQIWNSFDVIIYLYIDHKFFTKDLAIAAVRKLNSELAVDNPKMNKEKSRLFQERFYSYLTRIETVSKILKR
ncbi:hypothetical protein KAU33_11265 [Candidatus Dependentiae bacterium]|nr:hypothetical protein [Candidatus Dependentiae bacterium]